MKPKYLIECMKMTYDFTYAREILNKMISAAYPDTNISEPDKTSLMSIIHTGYQLNEEKTNVGNWNLEDVFEFIDLYQKEFQKNGDYVIGYLTVEALLNSIGKRVSELTDVIPEKLPFWFRSLYLQRELFHY